MRPLKPLSRRKLIGLTTQSGILFSVFGVSACQGVSGANPASPATPSQQLAASPSATVTLGATPTPLVTPSTPTTVAAATPSAAHSYKTDVKGKVIWLVPAGPVDNKGQEEVLDPLIRKTLPNVELERIILPSDAYIPKINSMVAANESLEIWGYGGNYYDYWVRGLPQDLTSYIQADHWDVQSYFLPGLMDIYRIGGKYWGLSQLTTFGSIMIYNRTAFDQADLKAPSPDWNDGAWNIQTFVEYARKLTKNHGKPDAFYGAVNWLWPAQYAMPYLWGTDGFLAEHYANFIAPKTQLNQQPIVDAFQWAQDLIFKHKVNPDPSATIALSQTGDPFMTGRVGMALVGGWVYWTSSSIKDFKYAFAPLPLARTRKNVTFNDFWIMARWSQNKDAAWQVMRVLTSVEGTKAYSKNTGTPPTVRESLDVWLQSVSQRTGQSVNDLRLLTLGGIEKGRSQESPDHLFVQHPKIEETFNAAIDPLWKSASVTAATEIPKVTAAVDRVVKEIYDQFKDRIPPH